MTENLGKNWILLRGLARESAHWGDFPAKLQSAFPEARVATLDLPGTGRFNLETCPRCIRKITLRLRNEATDQGLLHQPVTLLALSLGGMVTWEWLHSYPDDISGAVLMNTSLRGVSPIYERLRWQIYGKFLALLLQCDSYKRELAILKLVSNSANLDGQRVQLWADIQNKRPMTYVNILNQLVAAASFRPLLKKPSQPVLLLNSQGDRLVAPNCSETIQKIIGLELKTHQWGGHDLTIDDSLWVLAQLKTWASS